MSESLASLQQSDTDSMVHSASTNSLQALAVTSPVDTVLTIESQVNEDNISASNTAEYSTSASLSVSGHSSCVETVTRVDGATATIITISQENNTKTKGGSRSH